MIDVLVLAAALAQTAQPAEPASVPWVWTTVTTTDGQTRRSAGFYNPRWRTESLTYYLVAHPTACVTSATPRKPEGAFEGWAVTIGPGARGPLVTWTRFEKSRSVGTYSRTLFSASRATVVFDEWPSPPGHESCKAAIWAIEGSQRGLRDVEQENLVEAELWFVHKAPDGKETSQRQVLRLRKNNTTEFYFDDIEVATRWLEQDLKLTVEVFGALTIDEPKNGEVDMLLGLTRRYLTKQFLIGAWPKSGNTQLPTSVAVGEVVSFVLPPLQDDAGVFLGHRFSVRVRLKPLSPEGN